MDKYLFQNCQKIVVFSQDNRQVLLAKRKGERDFDGTWSFIGGKMETTDKDLVAGMKREKNEEIGENVKLKLYPVYSTANYYIKKDGSFMILPHYYAQFVSGQITINDEYSEYGWFNLDSVKTLEPKIPNLPEMLDRIVRLLPLMIETEFVEI